jgi:hypothetical protein
MTNRVSTMHMSVTQEPCGEEGLRTLCGIASVINDTPYDFVVFSVDEFWEEPHYSDQERCAACSLLSLDWTPNVSKHTPHS